MCGFEPSEGSGNSDGQPATAEQWIEVAHPVYRRKTRFARRFPGLATIPYGRASSTRLSEWSAPMRNGLSVTTKSLSNCSKRCFEEIAGYDEIVLLRDIRFRRSDCKHHMAPIIGDAHIAYLPNRRVVGISKLARLVQALAKRLQIQERMTAEIAQTIDKVLKPRGIALVIEAIHNA